MNTLDQIARKRSDILKAAARHGAYNIRVFGSVIRGEDKPGSDVDFLVATEVETSSWFPAGLILDLEATLGRPVDVVTENGLSPLLREHVLKEAMAL